VTSANADEARVMQRMSERIAVLGLGYVGLPVALAFAAQFPGTIGFDIDADRVLALQNAHDWTGETPSEKLAIAQLELTHDPAALKKSNVFVICVPTPVDAHKRPQLEPLRHASTLAGRSLGQGSIVVYESTVYPGLTEEFCVPILERESGLRCGADFFVGYAPERINPGDGAHGLSQITKVVAGCNDATAATLARLYGAIVEAGVHVAPSIRVAETAKVIENTQRDLNIALMNELAMICDRLGIRTADVLAAAGTKWNFLPFTPGLVGGHCIGVDPYYLTTKAEALGYKPDVILAGRRINDGVGGFVAAKVLRLLAEKGVAVERARVAVLGLAFKENIRDIRNSRVPDILRVLTDNGVSVSVCDPLADATQARRLYDVALAPMPGRATVDALILAVPHAVLMDRMEDIVAALKPNGILVDIKSVVRHRSLPAGCTYWSL
jgi:UDP-N-acetyl-D-galactosamine dehydrogenase